MVWISVMEKFPPRAWVEEAKPILYWRKEGGCVIDRGVLSHKVAGYTHWMPLPEPPDNGQEEGMSNNTADLEALLKIIEKEGMIDAPKKTERVADFHECLIPIGKDYTASIIIDEEAFQKLKYIVGKFGNEQ